MPWGLSFTWTCKVFTLQSPVLHLEVSTPQGPGRVYTTEACACGPPGRVYTTGF
jgi:hypothetical protein